MFKKGQIVVNVIVMAAIAYLIGSKAMESATEGVSGNNDLPGAVAETEEGVPLPVSTQEYGTGHIVYINTDSLWKNYKKVEDMKDDLLKEKNKSESQFKKEAEKLEKEVVEFRARARFQTQPEIERKQQELMMQEQGLMQLEERLTMKLAESERDKNVLIAEDIRNACNKLATERKYLYILTYTSAMVGEVVYADSSNDITKDVLQILNSEYTQNKTKK